MKICTDFVTNSSSYSTTSVVIDNPVLLEILEKYKNKLGMAGEVDVNYRIGAEHKEISGPAAFSVDYESFMYTPSVIYEVLGRLIEVIEEFESDYDLCEQMKIELNQHHAEILRGYKYIFWYGTCEGGASHFNDMYYAGLVRETAEYRYSAGKNEEYKYLKAGLDHDKVYEMRHINQVAEIP